MKTSLLKIALAGCFLMVSLVHAQVNLARLPGVVVTDPGDNSASHEGAASINDGSSSTKCLFFKDTTWIQFALPTAYTVNQYALTSANDAPGRDPANWTLYGSNDTSNVWSVLDRQSGQSFANRYQRIPYTVSGAGEYRYYRLAMRCDSGSILQVAEVELIGELHGHDVTAVRVVAPVDLIGGINMTPQLLVRTLGKNTESFSVTCRIDSAGVALYTNTQSVSGLASLDSQVVSFAAWTVPAGIRGTYAMTAWTSLTGDMFASNDTVIKTISVKHINLNVFPKTYQLYCRDAQDSAAVTTSGSLVTTLPESVSLAVYKNGALLTRWAEKLAYTSNSASFRFTSKIHAEFAMYKFVCKLDTVTIGAADSVVCGDAFLVDGQSNTVAGEQPWVTPWIRTFGLDTNWSMPNQNPWDIGKHLVEAQKIPMCFIEGAIGGTPVDQHQRDTTLNSIYGRDYWRITRGGLANGIKAALWHQGESNPGDTAYATKFKTMVASWKSDYPNIRHIFMFQVRPGCGSPGLEIVREQQRTMPYGRPDISVMSTGNITGHDGCHYSGLGYLAMGDCMYPLVAHYLYGSVDTVNMRPPDIQEAYFANSARTKVTLRFDQPVFVPTDTGINHAFAVGDSLTPLDSVRADTHSNTVNLYLHARSESSVVSYVLDHWGLGWNYEGPWLYNSRNIGALTFYRFPLLDSGMVTSVNGPEAAPALALTADPNPFNPSLNVRFSIPRTMDIYVAVYSVDGRLVRTLFNGAGHPGENRMAWDGRDERNRALGSGMYVLSFRGPKFRMEKRVVMLK